MSKAVLGEPVHGHCAVPVEAAPPVPHWMEAHSGSIRTYQPPHGMMIFAAVVGFLMIVGGLVLAYFQFFVWGQPPFGFITMLGGVVVIAANDRVACMYGYDGEANTATGTATVTRRSAWRTCAGCDVADEFPLANVYAAIIRYPCGKPGQATLVLFLSTGEQVPVARNDLCSCDVSMLQAAGWHWVAAARSLGARVSHVEVQAGCCPHFV
eukprot:CAMPEP_0174841848 /NCGR_PEP_ID=MMETSP1114-20130205/9576_1 /TAXON_ID=312471 /ORGANISM="Neobodo designis, Strain CCAP 1951/1" /LENGTH=209 /DNA_ID=CAMNT_0016076045 /DNA_START=1 /DNA_END=630 /DNA_ORIENTATION=+